ncbi:hypothetical protein UlMin_016077 [Ulmus minor]
MSYSTLPTTFWGHALLTACYLLNNVPPKSGIDYDETFSPVAMLKSIRILLSIAAALDYEIWQIDVKTAFLNGHLDESIYMVQPDGFKAKNQENKVCKLLKSIYGLKQASRSWNIRFDQVVKTYGFEQSVDEPCNIMIALSQSSYIDKVLKKFAMQDSKKGGQPSKTGITLSLDECPKTFEEKMYMEKVPYASTVRSLLLIFVFEPEIKGHLPEKVEYIGMKNLITGVKGSVRLRNGKLLFGFEDNNYLELLWGAFDDIVMGGVSESIFQIDQTGGVVSTENNGGFASIRTKDLWLVYFYEMNIGYIHFLTSIFICYQNFSAPEDLSAYDGLELHLKGDGRHYKLVVLTSNEWDALGYATGFDTVSGQWYVSDAPPFDPTNLMFSKFEYDGKLNTTFVEGLFQLSVSSIWTYLKDPISPRFVYVGSAGVTRLDRPGLYLSKQPLVICLNKELGSILTFKLKGDDLIRESGIPYAIVRPCALTEEPTGANLIFDQGDNITGKISRKEVGCICIAALASPYALDKTFETNGSLSYQDENLVKKVFSGHLINKV